MDNSSVSRRSFLKTSACTASAAVLADIGTKHVFAAGSDKIKIGLIGCGGRGKGAVNDCFNGAKHVGAQVEIIAVGDLYEDQAKNAKKDFATKLGEGCKINDDHVFWGFDAYRKVIDSGVDMIIHAGPPAFRPPHIKAAIEAGKHIFMEKPVAVDPVGCRMIIEASKMATEKKLGVVCGTQRRHAPNYIETMKRIHAGDIGELVGGQCYWGFGGGIWFREKTGIYEKLSDIEWQCHNWYHWDWLSGDQVCEQHIHNIDVLNWCFNGPPKKIFAAGGRVSRDNQILPNLKNTADLERMGKTDGHYNMLGNIYDHMAAELEYANGARCVSISGHVTGGSSRVCERIVGTKGTSNCAGKIEGEKPFDYKGESPSSMTLEHADLLKSIMDGKPLNEGIRIAESTLTAVGIRMSSYTGRELQWDWLMNASKLDIVPKDLKPGPGHFPAVAIPGVTKLV
jgi:predicted dehydrogenase